MLPTRPVWIVHAALAAVVFLLIAAGESRSTEQPTRVCFPRAEWSARWEDRPCTKVTVPEEDGSDIVYQLTAGDQVGVCILPNPYEERGRYVARCHRLPSLYRKRNR